MSSLVPRAQPPRTTPILSGPCAVGSWSPDPGLSRVVGPGSTGCAMALTGMARLMGMLAQTTDVSGGLTPVRIITTAASQQDGVPMKEAAVEAVVGPVLEQCGLELDRLEVVRAGKRSVVRVFVDGDGEDGRGPNLDDIAEATRAVSAALDVTDVTGEAPYTLEVSSRGTSRPLTAERHFRRNRDRLVAVSTAAESVTGRIAGVEDGNVIVDSDGVLRSLALADITQAVVQVELRKDRGDANDPEED